MDTRFWIYENLISFYNTLMVEYKKEKQSQFSHEVESACSFFQCDLQNGGSRLYGNVIGLVSLKHVEEAQGQYLKGI